LVLGSTRGIVAAICHGVIRIRSSKLGLMCWGVW
jgi:hypothetical protein